MAGSKSDLSNGSASPKSEPSLRSARKGSVSDLFQIRKVVQCLFSTIHPHKHAIMYHRKGFGGWLNFLSIKDSIKQRSGSGLLTVKSKNTLAKTLKPGQNMSIRLCGIVCVCVCVIGPLRVSTVLLFSDKIPFTPTTSYVRVCDA